MASSQLSNHLLLPVIDGPEVSYKRLRNTILGHLGSSEGISVPAIIKALTSNPDSSDEDNFESYRERCSHLLSQLGPITPDNGPMVFGSKLTSTYLPLLVRGSGKNQVLYVEQTIVPTEYAMASAVNKLNRPITPLVRRDLRSCQFKCTWSFAMLDR